MGLSLQDKFEIQQLCAKYYVSTDEQDVDGFMNCWIDSDDILFESEFGTFKGTKEIREFEDNHVHRGMAVGKRHLLGNVIVEDGDDQFTAYVTSYLVVMEVANIPQIVATAIYRRSKAIKTDDGWKFVHRKMDVDEGFRKLMAQGSAA